MMDINLVIFPTSDPNRNDVAFREYKMFSDGFTLHDDKSSEVEGYIVQRGEDWYGYRLDGSEVCGPTDRETAAKCAIVDYDKRVLSNIDSMIATLEVELKDLTMQSCLVPVKSALLNTLRHKRKLLYG